MHYPAKKVSYYSFFFPRSRNDKRSAHNCRRAPNEEKRQILFAIFYFLNTLFFFLSEGHWPGGNFGHDSPISEAE